MSRVPDFFLVGHPKCGTTALYETLIRQPGIYMPKLKEPEFFATEMREGPRPQELPDTLEEYLALFEGARPDQLAGEASTSYLRSHTAASRIAEIQPAARIVAILREPASLLRSAHLQYVQAVIETEYDLRRALELEEERRNGHSLPRHGFYPLAVLRPRSLRGAASSLPLGVRAGERACADLRRLPGRQRGDGTRGAALSRRA